MTNKSQTQNTKSVKPSASVPKNWKDIVPSSRRSGVVGDSAPPLIEKTKRKQ